MELQFANPWAGSRAVRLAALAALLSSMAAAQFVTSPAQSGAGMSAAARAAARPMPLRSATGTPSPAALGALTLGAPVQVNGNLPSSADAALAQLAAAAAPGATPAIGAGSTIWYDYPPPSTLSIPILDYIVAPQFPNTALGKLFFSGPGGSFVCSAQSVTSAGTWGQGNRQTVVTAGHCCSDGIGNFYTNWQFAPAYFNGNTPLGTWIAHSATVYNAWHLSSDLSVDYCVLQMRTLGGQNVNNAIGALGYAANQPLPQHYYATGWPAAAPFNGNLLYYATASDAETDTQQAGLLPFTHGIGSTMTGGSSGGGWIRGYQSFVAGNNNQFNGLNSYKYTSPNRPAEMFGPYIDSLFVSLLQIVATAPPAP